MGKQRLGKVRKYLALVCDEAAGVVSESPLEKDQMEFDFNRNGSKEKESEHGED